jgi:hypothetical protein
MGHGLRISGIETLRVDVVKCSRCGQDHRQLTVKELNRLMIVGAVCFNFWGACPVTREPILVRVAPDQERKIVEGNLLVSSPLG